MSQQATRRHFTHVYVAVSDEWCKVGVTANLALRLRDLSRDRHTVKNPFAYVKTWVVPVRVWACDVERAVRAKVGKAKWGNEYYVVSGDTAIKAVEDSIRELEPRAASHHTLGFKMRSLAGQGEAACRGWRICGPSATIAAMR